jgi:homoserine kinase
VTPPGARVVVRAPATSANLGPGFDAVALALALHDEVTAVASATPGVRVGVTGEGRDTVPRDGTHLVARAALAALDRFGTRPPGLDLDCVNGVPHGRGLGSSAAAIVSGVVAGWGLATGASAAPTGAAATAVLELAAEVEGHPDNVAACLLGGMTVAWYDAAGSARAARLEPSPALVAWVLVPDEELATRTARALLPEQVPHADAAHAAGRAALLVEAVTHRPDLLLEATEDRLHQPYRAVAMPASSELVERLRRQEVAAVVSGAGPSVLALTSGPVDLARLVDADPSASGRWRVQRLAVDLTGAALSRCGD